METGFVPMTSILKDRLYPGSQPVRIVDCCSNVTVSRFQTVFSREADNLVQDFSALADESGSELFIFFLPDTDANHPVSMLEGFELNAG